jgi:hypothetical protein|tara:strand:- start:6 stop:119 length:114 start_codon:yes stop_codon:yes gene_type:complete
MPEGNGTTVDVKPIAVNLANGMIAAEFLSREGRRPET